MRIWWKIAMRRKRPAGVRTANLGYHYQQQGGIMLRKVIIALACVLMASPAFAQTTTTTTTTTERVTVTGTLVGIEEGTAANYQPAKTLVVRTDNADQQRFELVGNGLVYDKLGRIVTGPVKPGTRVRIFYTSVGPTQRAVDRVELQE
jgi:hypothetical protein